MLVSALNSTAILTNELIIRLSRLITGVVMLSLASLNSQASLIGDDVGCAITPTPPWVCSPSTATVVDPGVEFQLAILNGDAYFDVDLSDSLIRLTQIGPFNLTAGPDDTLFLTSLDWIDNPGRIVDFELTTTAGVSNVDASDVSFTDDSVTFFMGAASFDRDSLVDIRLITEQVPIPGTLALIGLGLVGMGYRGRKNKAT
jgi:hypothetical protein